MSAAATAAGYLYASGRLRGRNGREQEHHHDHHEAEPQKAPEREARRVKVAVYEQAGQGQPAQPPAAPKKTPKIQYRTRRWRPE